VRFNRDVISGGTLLAFALLYLGAAWKLPAGREEPGPGFLPILLSLSLVLIAAWIIGVGLKKGTASKGTTETKSGPHRWKPLLAVILTALYAASFQALGFFSSTWLFTLSVTLLFRRDRLILPLVVPVLSTIAIYLLFEIGLGVRLPPGPIALN
jgi:hypothetical protein